MLPGYRRITEAVHRHGTPIFAQINHNGGQASAMYTRLPVWAPSPVADPLFREVPKAVDHGEIAEIVAGYADVAEHCARGRLRRHRAAVLAQLDRARLPVAGHQPCAPTEYGGSLDNRARLLLDLVAAVREAIGRDWPSACGCAATSSSTAARPSTRPSRWPRLVEATGHVDYINTSIGVATATLFMIEASMHIPPGYALFIPSAIRKAVDLPVVGVGRFKDPLQAERALAEGHCDLVGVVRGQIADADFAAQDAARATPTTSASACRATRNASGRMGLNRWLGCIENPRTGREADGTGTVAPGAAPQAGPRGRRGAGGHAGRHRRGPQRPRRHGVRAPAQRRRTGAARRLACRTGPSSATSCATRWPSWRALGVTVEYGVDVDATRGPPACRRPRGRGHRRGRRRGRGGLRRRPTGVVDVRAVLAGEVEPDGSVLVIDEIGFHHATSVAELLADRGCTVEVVTPGMVVGQDLGITLDLENWWIRANAKGITQSIELVAQGFDLPADGDPHGGTLHLLHHPTGADGRPHARLARAGGPRRPGRAALPRAARRGRAVRSPASATAWRRGGPTPRWSRASGRGRRL